MVIEFEREGNIGRPNWKIAKKNVAGTGFVGDTGGVTLREKRKQTVCARSGGD